MKVKNIIIRNS